MNRHVTLLLCLSATSLCGGEPLFQDGRTAWRICLSPEAEPAELYAAQELRQALRKVSGADFEILSSRDAPQSRAIIVGDLDNSEVRAQAGALKLRAGRTEQVAVYTLGERLYLAGNESRGALYAVYSFLQRELGVRWLWPGPDGEFIPTRRSWTLPDLAINHTPAFRFRGFHLCGDWRDHVIFREWMSRNFINIHRHAASVEEKRMGFHSMWSSHNARIRDKAVFADHPEYFAEVNGTRYREGICFSNPAVDTLVANDMAEYVRKRPQLDILSIFPSDNQTYCRCSRCAETDVSTAWFEFYNRLTDALSKEFPGLKFSTIAYQGYRDVPRCRIRNSAFVEYATYMRCNTHPFGHPGCERNDDMMAALLNWKATGLEIGNYAYEYDVFSRNGRFVPFLTVIDDVVRTSRELGHASVITEVPLSPKLGPDVHVRNVQNRLSIYVYARLLWDPDQDMFDILRDWCRTAFGEAAGPMLEYYRLMDRAWTAMSVHTGILGDALTVVDQFLAGDLQETAVAALAAADKAAAGIEEPLARERTVAAIERERVLFQQWLALRQAKNTDVPRLSLPLLVRSTDLKQSSCRAQALHCTSPAAESYPTDVRAAWTREALLIRWACHASRTGAPKTVAKNRGDGVEEDDSVELVLSDGVGGETWHLAVNAKGTMQARRTSHGGAREGPWSPEWQAEVRQDADGWGADMTIPFGCLDRAPNPDDVWQVRFRRYGSGRRAAPSGVFPVRETAMLVFTPAARTGRALLWWSGAPERESNRDARLRQEVGRIGWELNVVTTGEELLAAHDRCEVFWFRHPGGPNRVPADYWSEHLAPAVRKGALAVFASYWNIRLDEYFGDPSLKAKVVACGKVPLAGRRSSSIAPGPWATTPNDLLPALKRRITPAYGFLPAELSDWTVWATAPRQGGDDYPYLLTRSYGQGTIILCGDSIAIPAATLLANFAAHHSRRGRAAGDLRTP